MPLIESATVELIVKECSPSIMPGTGRRPIQRSSRFISALRTVGLKVIPIPLEALTVTDCVECHIAGPPTGQPAWRADRVSETVRSTSIEGA